MKPPIALQLYSVREQIKHDFEGVVRKIATMGYDGVETAGFADVEPQVAARLFQELDLAICSAHTPLPTRENQQQVFDVLALLQCQRAVCAWQPPERFESVESIRRVAEELNTAAGLAAEHGVTLHYHNHWFELYPVEGRPALDWLLDELDPAVKLEVDTYWARTGGVDPVALLKELGPRAPLLHIKDGPCTVEDPMVAVGDGMMDIPAILVASNGHAQWLIVELDRCATDMLEAVERSFQYLSRLIREQR